MKLARVVLALPMLFGLFILLYISSGDLEKFIDVNIDRIESITIFFDSTNNQIISRDGDIEVITTRLKTYKLRRVLSLSKNKPRNEAYKLILEGNNEKAFLSLQDNNILSISKDGRVYNDFKVTGDILNLDEIMEIYNKY